MVHYVVNLNIRQVENAFKHCLFLSGIFAFIHMNGAADFGQTAVSVITVFSVEFEDAKGYGNDFCKTQTTG